MIAAESVRELGHGGDMDVFERVALAILSAETRAELCETSAAVEMARAQVAINCGADPTVYRARAHIAQAHARELRDLVSMLRGE